MTIRTTIISVLVAVSLAACGRETSRSAPAKRDVESKPDLSATTQKDLAAELEDADRRGTWSEVRQRWQGQHLRWTVTRQRVLCSSATECHVAPFPIQRPAQQGWLPALQMSSAEFAKLEASCGRAEQCELTFEGTLSDLAISGELPTSMRFSNVRVLSARKT